MRLASRQRGVPPVSQADRDRRWFARLAECLQVLDSNPTRAVLAEAEKVCHGPMPDPRQHELEFTSKP